MSGDFEKWDATPYQPDPPAITEAEAAEQRWLRVAAKVFFWACAIALVAFSAWAILTVKPF